jgi:hypothetical protein
VQWIVVYLSTYAVLCRQTDVAVFRVYQAKIHALAPMREPSLGRCQPSAFAVWKDILIGD